MDGTGSGLFFPGGQDLGIAGAQASTAHGPAGLAPVPGAAQSSAAMTAFAGGMQAPATGMVSFVEASHDPMAMASLLAAGHGAAAMAASVMDASQESAAATLDTLGASQDSMMGSTAYGASQDSMLGSVSGFDLCQSTQSMRNLLTPMDSYSSVDLCQSLPQFPHHPGSAVHFWFPPPQLPMLSLASMGPAGSATAPSLPSLPLSAGAAYMPGPGGPLVPMQFGTMPVMYGMPNPLQGLAPVPAPVPPPLAQRQGSASSVHPITTVKHCTVCGITTTPTWRRHPENGSCVCNACGLYFKLHTSNRVVTLSSRGLLVAQRKPRRSRKRAREPAPLRLAPPIASSAQPPAPSGSAPAGPSSSVRPHQYVGHPYLNFLGNRKQ